MKIELGAVNKADAKLILRALRAEPKLQWYTDLLASDIEAGESIPIAPWRKVVGRARGLHAIEELECGHRYVLRYSKNWQEDHALKRRCQRCLPPADRKLP